MTPDIVQRPSPNQGPRRDGLRPSLVVLHYTEMQNAEAACAWLCDPIAEVSAHYLIRGDGQVLQLVPEDQRAWHAGDGEWHGKDDINSRSIGIELDNRGTHPFSEPQMRTLEWLLTGIMSRWNIPPAGVIAHSDMAPGRKVDPGRRFDWSRLARGGLAAPSGTGQCPKDQSPASFRSHAARAGYSTEVSDKTLLQTIRMRHRPHATGGLTSADFAALPAVDS